MHILPDFTTNSSDSTGLIYIHKTIGEKEVFFVVNQQDYSLKMECLFRIENMIPEIWYPMTGDIRKPRVYSVENGQTRIPVTFEPKESLFFVFKKGEPVDNINKVVLNNNQIFPSSDNNINFTNVEIPQVVSQQYPYKFVAGESGNYIFSTRKGKNIETWLNKPEIYEISDFSGEIKFNPIYDK